MKLQTEFVEAQVEAVTELVRDLNEGAAGKLTHSAEAQTPHTQATVTPKNFAGPLAQRHGMASEQVEELLTAAIASISKRLKSGDRIRIAGFSTFEVRIRAARLGRHPASGEQIAIKASKTIAFRASRHLTEAISNGE